jgi:hypothetical protein
MERDDSPRQRHHEGGPALAGVQGGGISIANCPVATIVSSRDVWRIFDAWSYEK